MSADDLDRIKRPEQRLVERSGRTAADGPDDGRAALFSAGPTPSAPQEVGIAVALRCERCAATTPVGLRELAAAAFPLVVINPLRRRHPVFALCPACRQRSWLAVVRT